MRSFVQSSQANKAMNKNPNKIEILAPAGDLNALVGAIYRGCDAVYFGTDSFNARIRAKNFTLDEAKDAIALAHAHGVRVYITLNTQLYERELGTMLEYVARLNNMGADAFIVADFGVASLIKEKYPEIEVHASTQASVHNLDGANYLVDTLNQKRVVLARELDKKNIEYISKNAKCETEIFIHGAHCMSVSGQCLMSYALGGRSGNRGECAQPCRLPYAINGKNGYFLSLKDMSLALHMAEILSLGVSSLKIEGRMKGQDYVSGTVGTYRTLVDEKRNANNGEIKTLGALFSRQGFTDGYYLASIDRSMLGVRTEKDKELSREAESASITLEKIPLDIRCTLRLGQKAMLWVSAGDKEVMVEGEIVEKAINAPMTRDDIKKNLSKLGNTPFCLGKFEATLDDGIIIRVSALNALRREAINKLLCKNTQLESATYAPSEIKRVAKIKTASFLNEEQIPQNKDYFDVIFLPLDSYSPKSNGIAMPPVIFDNEWDEIEAQLVRARESGAEWALVCNIGQIERVKKHGFKVLLDYRFNVFNRPCVDYLMKSGAENLVLSPELSLAQARDFYGYSLIVYGKIPLMTTHKCVLKDTTGCEACQGYMKDRQGASFYVKGNRKNHRNTIYNSVPIYMADKISELSGFSQHFIFSDESRNECQEIIECYKTKKAPKGSFRRIK